MTCKNSICYGYYTGDLFIFLPQTSLICLLCFFVFQSWISLRCKAQHINDFPKNCYGHCTISLHEVQDSETDPSVVLLWGRTGQMSYQDDMWQLTISSEGGIWRKVNNWQYKIFMHEYSWNVFDDFYAVCVVS